jgi:hypothetical protein
MILVARWRLKNAPPASDAMVARRRRIIGWALGGEGLAIAVVSHLMVKAGLIAFIVPAVAIIVGLHFLPLAVLLKVRIYYATALLITLAGLAGLLIDPSHRGLMTGLPVAGLLWLTCVYRLATEAPKRVVAQTA